MFNILNICVFVGPHEIGVLAIFRVFHGGCFDSIEANYIGGEIAYFDWVNFEKLSLVDIDCIDTRTCACKKWQLIGIPCIHGMSALLSSNRDPLDYVDNVYKKDAFLKAYNPVIYGINGPSMWPTTTERPVQCPEFKKQRGRPKKARKLQLNEVRVGGRLKLRRNYIVVTCKKCGQQDHNRTTCDKRLGMSYEDAGVVAGSASTVANATQTI